jgi:hypothetical protein
VSITGAILTVILVACLWPANFELEGKGELQPAVRRDVFADINGTVTEVNVDHGDDVQEGEVLVRLVNTELDRNITEVQGRITATGDEMNKLTRRRRDRTTPEDEKRQIGGELVELKKQRENLETQLALYLEEEQKLEVRSPIRGKVITWDVRNLLLNRPVQRGQKLMRVADPDQEWHLEVDMPEHRMGHIAKANTLWVAASRERWQDELGEVSDDDWNDFLAGIASDRWTALSEEEVEALNPEALRDLFGPQVAEKLGKMSPTQLRSFLEEVDPRLPVEYILKNDPGTKRQGRVKKMGKAARVQGDEGNAVPIKIAIDYQGLRQELTDRTPQEGKELGEQASLRPGTQVSAKVYCGRRSLAFVWLHDAIAFVQSKVLFRLF